MQFLGFQNLAFDKFRKLARYRRVTRSIDQNCVLKRLNVHWLWTCVVSTRWRKSNKNSWFFARRRPSRRSMSCCSPKCRRARADWNSWRRRTSLPSWRDRLCRRRCYGCAFTSYCCSPHLRWIIVLARKWNSQPQRLKWYELNFLCRVFWLMLDWFLVFAILVTIRLPTFANACK